MALDFPFILPIDAPLKVVKGSYFTKAFRWKSDNVAVPITGYTFEAQFREKYESTTPILTLTTAGGGLTITNASDGRFSMNMSPAQTAEFDVPLKTKLVTDIPFKDYVFDIEAIPADATKRFSFLKGIIRVYAEVTRD